jgi:PAS domain S-box-containing protein
MPPEPVSPADDPLEITGLSRKLEEIDAQLLALTGGEVDAVISSTGESFLLQKAQLRLLASDREQKILTQQLRKESSQLLAAQTVAKLGSWSFEVTDRAMEWSAETYRIFETDPGRCQATCENAMSFIHPDDRAMVESEFLDSLEHGMARSVVHRLLLSGNRIKFMQQRWQVYRDESGAPLRALGTGQDVTERRQAELALSDSQAGLRMVSRLGRIGSWAMDPATHTVTWSDEVYAIHEVAPGTTVTFDQALQFYPAEWRHAIRSAVTNCLEQGTPFDLELEIITARGRRIWIRAIGEAAAGDTGGARLIQGAFQDLSERKLAEREERRVAARLTNTLEALTLGFFTTDQEWRFTYFNGEAERMFGRQRDELMGEVLWEQLPQFLGSDFEISLRRAQQQQREASSESRFKQDGPWLRVSAYPTEEGLAVYVRDITLDHANRGQLKLLEESVAHLNDMVVITEAAPLDEPGPRMVFVNDAVMRRTGYTPEELIGKSPRLFQGPRTDVLVLDRIRSQLARFEPVHAEIVNYTKGGDAYWLEMDIVPVASAGSGYSHFVAIERDITERKHNQQALLELNLELESRVQARTVELTLAREEAEQANRTKSTFLATMSHEIRTPMNGVLGLLDVLSQTSLLSAQSEIVQLIRDSADALLRIIDDILDFSKIEAGKLRVESASMGLQEVVEKVCGLLDSIAVRAQVGLTLFVDPAIPGAVFGDELRLRQVLLNLIGNAIKFSSGCPQPGRVAVRVELVELLADSVAVDLSVADNGIGMDQDTLARLFAPFTQADASTTRRFGGTGLGLAISRTLVRLMGGEIKVTSAPAEGSVFSVRLSFAVAAGTQERSAPETPLQGLHVRIAGGDPQLANDLAKYIAHAGAIVAMATDALHAATPPDLSLWLLLPDKAPHDMPTLRARAAAVPGVKKTQFVILGRGPRRQPQIDHPDQISIDVDGLSRQMLLRTLALAAGRIAADPAIVGPATLPGTAAVQQISGGSDLQCRILVAEDHETNREVVKRQLQLLGIAAVLAVDGREALELWRVQRFPLVLTDIRMPDLDGYALTRAIRSEEAPGRRTAIIALTANALPEEAVHCREAGMDDYLVKPVGLLSLRTMIEKWLPPPVPVEPEGAPADLGVLRSMLGDDPVGVAAVLVSFRATAAELSEELGQAVAAGSPAAAVSAAHKLKSGSLSIGAQQLGELCAQMESAGLAGREDLIATLLPLLRNQLQAVLAFLDSTRQ